MGELELAGFHLLSHVGGEVIRESKRGVKLLGLKATERVGTAAVGKATGDPQEPETRQPGGTGGPGGPGGPRRAEEGRGGPCSVLCTQLQQKQQEAGRGVPRG